MASESNGTSYTRSRSASRQEFRPELGARSVHDGGDHWLDLLVRERSVGRTELQREGQALAAFRERPAAVHVEHGGSVEERSSRRLDRRVERPGGNVLGHHEGQIPPYGREARDLDQR